MKTLEKRFENISLCVSTEKDGESVRERVMVKSVRSRQSKIKSKHSSLLGAVSHLSFLRHVAMHLTRMFVFGDILHVCMFKF